jgi:7,8-dihydroneopterin aldolase/epimerase/oxygenase
VNQMNDDALNYASATRRLRHVFVRGLRVSGSIGIHPHEYEAKQDIVIDINAAVHEPNLVPENIDQLVCYEDLTIRTRAIVDAGHIDLVETLAEQIAQEILTDNRILMVRVRVEKPSAIADASGVGVEIERHQS